jgi:hypothetical protein
VRSLFYFHSLFVLLVYWSSGFSQEILHLPTPSTSHHSVLKASDWLVKHVQRGTMDIRGQSTNLSVIAWKDPTLAPDELDWLAGYAITDTLWASYALTLTEPRVASELRRSLKELDCLSNNLHEVLWQPIPSIHHKPIDIDIVHGRSLGTMSVGSYQVDIRSFTMAADPEFDIGHPSLFAEHAVYQSLFEYRAGKIESAKNRMRQVFHKSSSHPVQEIYWDSQRNLLVDFVIKSEYAKFISGASGSCRQYSFKLAVLLYACRYMELDREFAEEIEKLEQVLNSVQLSDGGIPHFFDVESKNEICKPCPDATGEATAIFILAKTVSPPQRPVHLK